MSLSRSRPGFESRTRNPFFFAVPRLHAGVHKLCRVIQLHRPQSQIDWYGITQPCDGRFYVCLPERSKGVDSSSTVFALVGSSPTADNTF